MKAKCVVNSEGIVVDTHDKPNVFKIRNLHQRIEELENFTEKFASALTENGIKAHKDGFVYKVQPFYNEDRIYMFYKSRLDASSPLVRQAYTFKTKGLQPDMNEENVKTYKSVFYEEIRAKTYWYVLQAQEFVLERNVFDCQWQNIVPQKPITYQEFAELTKTNVLTKEDVKKGIGSRDYYFPQEQEALMSYSLLNAALTLDGGDMQAAYDTVRKDLGFDKKKDYANKALFCLYAINDLKYTANIYPLYLEAREIIKQVLPQSRNVRYNGKTLTFEQERQQYTIYVSDPLNKDYKQTFIINGNIIHGLDGLRNELPSALTPCRWFEEVVIPNTEYGKDSNYERNHERQSEQRNR